MISAQYQRAMLIANAILVSAMPVHAQGASRPWRSAANADAIAALSNGEKPEANAGWWGFNADDATDAVQSAIDSGARKVVVPFVGKPWIVRPLKLRSHMEFVLEPGVLLLAKRGEYKGKGDSLLSIADAEDVTVRGPGATIRMWKSDYQNPPYEKAEWRMGVRILGSRNVLVEGVRIESSGGDGIYISGTAGLAWSENVTIRNVLCDDHHRQGISVISAENLLIENCVLSNTGGAAPQAGIDFEPNSPNQRLMHCVLRNCQLYDNRGNQLALFLANLDETSEPVDIRFENCHVRSGPVGMPPQAVAAQERRGENGICVGACRERGPTGTIVFEGCTAENSPWASVLVFDWYPGRIAVTFERCAWANSWLDPQFESRALRPSVMIDADRPEAKSPNGGITFNECAVIDLPGRQVVGYIDPGEGGLEQVAGTIYYRGSGAPAVALGDKQREVTLQVEVAGE